LTLKPWKYSKYHENGTRLRPSTLAYERLIDSSSSSEQGDSTYIVIKGRISDDLLDRLFAHTARLREHPPKEPAIFVDLQDQYSIRPNDEKGPYSSFYILDPVITVERHDKEIRIAARFNIETTVLRYNSQKRSNTWATVSETDTD
jgi:hypothetical protein